MTNVVQLRSKRRGAVDEGGGDLAGLIRLYFQQIAADDAAPDETDEEGDARRAATFEATLERIEETPVRNREDALAAIEWFFREGEQFDIELKDPDHFHARVLRSLRAYIAREMRS